MARLQLRAGPGAGEPVHRPLSARAAQEHAPLLRGAGAAHARRPYEPDPKIEAGHDGEEPNVPGSVERLCRTYNARTGAGTGTSGTIANCARGSERRRGGYFIRGERNLARRSGAN